MPSAKSPAKKMGTNQTNAGLKQTPYIGKDPLAKVTVGKPKLGKQR